MSDRVVQRVAGRIARVAAAWCLSAVVLGGCGEPSADEVRTAYCETVKKQQRALSDVLADRSATALLDARPQFEALADAAPRDIADEWRVLLLALGRVEDTLAEAGVDPATYDPGSPPPGLIRAQRGAIERAAGGLLDPRVQEAVAAVDQQARDVCQAPLFQ